MKNKIKTLLQIFITFLKIGAFTFGGGYAMIPIIQREVVKNKKWVSDEDVIEILAIAELTPGPISVNAATFIGYRIAGFWGAFCGTFGVVLPSFVIILIISYFLRAFQNNIIVEYAFKGIRAGILALIINALFVIYNKLDKNRISYLIMILALILTAFLDINIIFAILICATIGLVYSVCVERRINK